MITKDKVIVLRTTAYGESDLVLQTLNPRGAKFSLFAKGALKSKKRFAGGVLEPSHYIQVVYKRPSHTNGLALLQEAALLEGFVNIRQSYDKLELAFHFLQLISRLCQEGVEDAPDLFDILGNSLRALQDSSHLELLKLHFDMKLLAIQGVLPPLAKANKLLSLAVRDHARISVQQSELRTLQAQSQSLLAEYLGPRA